MTSIASHPREDMDRRTPTSRNPYVVALVCFALFSGLLAYMLWLALLGITDFAIYDRDVAAGLVLWICALVFSGVAAMVGAALLAHVRQRKRRHVGR